ncbi:MAG: hypothetical protein KC486_27765, partial [Myxococcales bacterium]|nr:hypothetical protein [Myxococcales bacterium]
MRPRCRWRPRLFAAGLALSLPAAGCGRVVDTSRPAGADAETADVEVSVDAPVEALPELLLFTGFERRFVPGITGATAIDSVGDAYHCVLRAAAHPLCWRGPMACESSAALEPAVDVGVAPRQLARGCFIRSDGRAGCRDRQGAPARHVDVADAVV